MKIYTGKLRRRNWRAGSAVEGGGGWRLCVLAARGVMLILSCAAMSGCHPHPRVSLFNGEPYLIVWAGDADRRDSDFLAVIDADPTSVSYGTVVHTVPVGSAGNEPHAMERSLGPDGVVFAGGLLTDRTFVFDVRDPPAATLAHVDVPLPRRRFGTPRSYTRLPGGHRIAACGDPRQYRGGVLEILHGSGGLVEFDSAGRFLREIDTLDPEAAGMLDSPHGVAISENTDRLLLTDAGHGYTPTAEAWTAGMSVQVRVASTGELVQTVALPVGERGTENLGPTTVHLITGGKVALVSTMAGGLYVSRTVASQSPVFALAHDFGRDVEAADAVITPNERYYLQALTAANRLEVVDIQEPMHPRVVNRLRFDRDPVPSHELREGGPSSLGLSADGRRLAVADYTIDVPARYRDGDRRVYMVDVDPEAGAVGFDMTFRDEVTGGVGVDFNRSTWPHGATGPARPAGVLFVARQTGGAEAATRDVVPQE